MADASYDAVVIGGGPNGLTLACYLANAGLDVAVLERQHELGGGACGEEIPAPGFLSNPCGHWVYFYRNPAWHDFKLYEKGLKYAYHDDLGYGIIFDNGTCLQGYSVTKVIDPLTGKSKYWPENAEKGLREIARFSERDAETASIIREKWQGKWEAAYEEWVWNPPSTTR